MLRYDMNSMTMPYSNILLEQKFSYEYLTTSIGIARGACSQGGTLQNTHQPQTLHRFSGHKLQSTPLS